MGALLMSSGQAMAGEVRGQIKYDGRPGAPTMRTQGFVERIANPLRPIKRFDPRPYMIVVFEGGPADEQAASPPTRPVPYDLLGESFGTPVLPVVRGSKVEIHNRGHWDKVITALGRDDFQDKVIRPGESEELVIAEVYKPVVLRAPTMSHPRGTIVAFPNRYFTTVDRRGRFELDGLPEGTWKVRLWYNDGWVDGVAANVQVGRRRAGEVTLRVSVDKLTQPVSE
ncbi:MAG: hypothetical protein AAGC55_13320 [Myxococcota bacterium]